MPDSLTKGFSIEKLELRTSCLQRHLNSFGHCKSGISRLMQANKTSIPHWKHKNFLKQNYSRTKFCNLSLAGSCSLVRTIQKADGTKKLVKNWPKAVKTIYFCFFKISSINKGSICFFHMHLSNQT